MTGYNGRALDGCLNLSQKEINTNLESFIELVIECLEESNIEYVIIGGIASIKWGRPRTTSDVDVIINAEKEKIDSLVKVLEKNGFDYRTQDIIVAIQEKSLATVLHQNFPYKIDIQGIYEPLNERALKNRMYLKIFNRKAYLEKPEDLIIAKLKYGSETDFNDVKAILLRQKESLDGSYIQQFAQQEGVLKELEICENQIEKYRKKSSKEEK